jgi:hypothetical protein
MGQIAIVARLKDGAETKAAELVASGPPFDLAGAGLDRHAVYIAADEVVFVFEGPEVESLVGEIVDQPFQWQLSEAFDAWRELVEGQPRIARAAYAWVQEVESSEIAST